MSGSTPRFLSEAIASDQALAELAALQEEHANLAVKVLADNTLRYLEPDWNQFTAWCHEHDLTPITAAGADSKILSRDWN